MPGSRKLDRTPVPAEPRRRHGEIERGADAVSRDIADQEVEELVARSDQSVVSADAPHRLVVGLDRKPAPGQSLGCQALLHAFRKQQFAFDFALARFQPGIRLLDFALPRLKHYICVSQPGLGTFLLADIRRRNDPKGAPAGIRDSTRGNQYRQARYTGLRHIKLE